MGEASTIWVLARMIGSLILVVGLIYGLSYLFRNFMRPERWLKGDQVAAIQMRQIFALEPKKKLMIVEVEGRRLLLGLSEHSVSLLTELSEGKTVK